MPHALLYALPSGLQRSSLPPNFVVAQNNPSSTLRLFAGRAIASGTLYFHRFYRVNSDRSHHTGGSGLGLAIAQAIVQAHQGNIQVESQPNKGSTLIVRLPLR